MRSGGSRAASPTKERRFKLAERYPGRNGAPQTQASCSGSAQRAPHEPSQPNDDVPPPPLLVVKHNAPSAQQAQLRRHPVDSAWPPGESAGGGLQRGAARLRCVAHGARCCRRRPHDAPQEPSIVESDLGALKWHKTGPRALTNLHSADSLAALPADLPSEQATALADAVTLDARRILVLLAAGATRLHVDDFEQLLLHPLLPGWRLWRAGVSQEPPPRPGALFTLLPAWAAGQGVDGELGLAWPDWLHLIALAPTLEALALENGEGDDEDPVAAQSLRFLLDALPQAPRLRALALGFFDSVTDQHLQARGTRCMVPLSRADALLCTAYA